MKNTKPMRSTNTPRRQPPVRPVEERRETRGFVDQRLPWLVGVPREPGRIPAAIILPVRLFLGITYLYAGIQKFMDPQFFSPTAPGFIGEQMQGYVRSGSPLSPLLTSLVIPHAAAFGALITGGIAKSRTPNQDFTDASASLPTAGAAPPAAPTTTAQAAIPTALVGQAPSAATAAPTSPSAAPGATPAAPPGTTFLGSAASLAVNSAARFTDPGSGDPAVLIHLPSGQFVAYDAVCTHSGCTVGYSSSRQMLVCPCHGAVFDPAHGARGVSGPSRTPLATLQVQVDAQGNAYIKSA